jgi:hypothetical protein
MDHDASIDLGDGGRSEERRPKIWEVKGRSEEKRCYAVSSKQRDQLDIHF